MSRPFQCVIIHDLVKRPRDENYRLRTAEDLGTPSPRGICLTAFRIRFILVLDEALEPALPASAPWFAVILKLRARHTADGAHLVNWVERMPACSEPI
jgi:hypothetical protein